MSLCTVANIKTYLNITTTEFDNLFTMLINSFDFLAEKHCNREFDEATVTEYHDGGFNRIFVNRPPIDSGTAVTVYDDPDRSFSSTDLVDSDDYGIDYDLGILEFDYDLLEGNMSVKVTYKGGYATIPGDLQLAAIEQVVMKYKEAIKGELGIVNRTWPDGSVSVQPVDLLPYVRKVLDSYII